MGSYFYNMPHITTPICAQLHYLNTGSGPAIILLHGFPESSILWQELSAVLSTHYTVLAPDFPGCGSSSMDSDTGIDDMARCVIAIMDAEKIEKAVIGGHSMGGYVAFSLARLYPERVAGLSMIHSTPLPDDEEKKTARRKAIEIIRTGGKTLFINQMASNLFSALFKQLHPEIVQKHINDSLEMSETAMINCYHAMIQRIDHSSFISGNTFPMQWIMGEDDNIIAYKKTLQYCNKAFVNFVSLYKSCGHMGMYESKDNLQEDLTHFIKYCYTYQQK